MHEHSKATWEALPRVLELLKSKGYQTVTVSELISLARNRAKGVHPGMIAA